MKKYIEPVPGSGVAAASGKRIYCVVANYVQAPLTSTPTDAMKGTYERLLPNELTRTIAQPAGRVMAQGEHVVSRVRDVMIKEAILVKLNAGTLKNKGTHEAIFDCYCEPLTTINLLVRDSYELNQVFYSLKFAGIKVHDFHDYDQPDYGSVKYRVRTAIATEPVWPEEVVGILDYLPLWKPEKI